ncbi:Pimeloyl-ACP methyl ester carboxylesterase [Chitinophaga jiangningensis]|uniref:Pimeloyl-ACP methyl ester carboxylesterase n=1 Tax=Chitinophaga jiangningensis TaxID=1419482 RepID=A0A1M7J0J9_9BACT|nr:epoxide hydrolase family protein [Chitinophaga jiangningensis]SHM46624.1 Pimeloyl-ACP methyl ester carboxylesterase [Chitinophaga jiangningensis]
MCTPFQIYFSQEMLDDLRARLAATRWITEIDNSDWMAGTNKAYLQELCAYWFNEFNWEQQQQYLNTFRHYTSEIQGSTIHYIWEKGRGNSSIPLLLTHGYPDSFVRFLKLIPLLTAADEEGVSFDVVVPSIPGYGFSGKPIAPGMNPSKIASVFAALMQQLGYDTFMAHGGDWGSTITELLARQHPDQVAAIHLTDIPFIHLFEIPPGELSQAEKEYLEKGKQWQQLEGAYAMIQSTKPQTLGYGLNDSPAGLAAWIIEKFYRWSDHPGDLEAVFTKDELLTNLTIYWGTETIHSANRLYYEMAQAMASPQKTTTEKLATPAGVAEFKDLIAAPRDYAERLFNVQRWTEFDKGGHFAAMEQPALLAGDIRTFFSSL